MLGEMKRGRGILGKEEDVPSVGSLLPSDVNASLKEGRAHHIPRHPQEKADRGDLPAGQSHQPPDWDQQDTREQGRYRGPES